MIAVVRPQVPLRRRPWARAGSVLLGLLLPVGLLSACGGSPTPSPAAGQASGPASSVGTASASAAQSAAAPSAGASATGPGPGDIATPPDPCALLSTAELQAATGVAFPAGQKTSAGPLVECAWAAGSKTAYLTIGPLDAKAFATGKSVSQAMTGLGDDAYVFPKPLELHVADVNLEITAQVALGADGGADTAAELALMRVVLVKLAT